MEAQRDKLVTTLRQAQGDKVETQGDKVETQGDKVEARGDSALRQAQRDKVEAQRDKLVEAQRDNLVCVVLAAGVSRRFVRNKLLHVLPDGGTLLERAVKACGAYSTIVVCARELEARLEELRVRAIVNHRPEMGMTGSLQLANAAIDAAHAIAVLPADLTLIEPAHVRSVVAAAADSDVTFPCRSDGTPGHPVVFSAHARTFITQLPAGDTIRMLRDRADLTRRTLAIQEAWPYRDVDRESDLDDLSVAPQHDDSEPR